MKKLIFLILTFNYCLNAQDSIRFKSGEVKAIKIFGVTSFGVKYHNVNDLNGNLLFAVKNDVAYIRYLNGEVDSLHVKRSSTEQTAIAKDTIGLRNGKIKTGKVIEINTSQIKFRRSKNTDASIDSISKNEVSWIKFENGVIEYVEYKSETDQAQGSTSDPSLMVKKPVMTQQFNDRRIFIAIEELNLSQSKIQLQNDFEKMTHHKHVRYTSSAVGWGLGGAVLFVAACAALIVDSYGDSPTNQLISGVAIGVPIMILGQAISNEQKKKRRMKKQEIIRLYNSLE